MDNSSFAALKLFDDDSDDWDKSSLESLSNHIMDFTRYEVKELIAKGGMKEVYKAFDKQNGRFIAMAKLRQDVKDEQSEDFLKEAYLTAKLEHPNIISLYDIGVDKEGYPIFTMELKVGDTLSDILKKRHEKDEDYLAKFPLNKRLEIFLKICDAISYAHSMGILHLDIKPDNVQVGKFGEVQVCDWGLGTKIEDANASRVKDLVKGTPGYMAPEQIDVEHELGYHTDIYSLGALLYTILTDKEPMNGGMLTLMKKTISGDIPDPNDNCPNRKISESLSAVVAKAMSVESSERYQSVEDLQTEVEFFLSGRSTVAEEAGFLKEAILFYKRNSVICIIMILSFLVIITVSTVFLYKQNLTNLALQKSNDKRQLALEESEKNYSLYKDKVEAEKKLIHELLIKTFTQDYLKFEGIEFFSKKANKLNHVTNNLLEHHKAIPENRVVIKKCIEALFICQRFDEIVEFESKSSSPLIPIAKKFSLITQRRKGLLMSKDFLNLLQEINKLDDIMSKNFMERVVYFYQTRRERSFADLKVVKEMLKCWNRSWNENNFIYNSDNFTLKVWGENLRLLKGNGKYSSHLSFLRFLKIDALNLSNSGIENLYQVRNLNIKSLDISATSIKDLSELKLLPELRALIIDKGQVPFKGPSISKRITIEEK